MMPNQARLIDARYQESHGQADRNQARNETAQQMSQALQQMSQALARFIRRCRRERIIGGHAHMPRTLAGSARSARRKTRRHIVASCVFLDDSTRALAMRAYSEGQPRQPQRPTSCLPPVPMPRSYMRTEAEDDVSDEELAAPRASKQKRTKKRRKPKPPAESALRSAFMCAGSSFEPYVRAVFIGLCCGVTLSAVLVLANLAIATLFPEYGHSAAASPFAFEVPSNSKELLMRTRLSEGMRLLH